LQPGKKRLLLSEPHGIINGDRTWFFLPPRLFSQAFRQRDRWRITTRFTETASPMTAQIAALREKHDARMKAERRSVPEGQAGRV
jgi:hypothetical protein